MSDKEMIEYISDVLVRHEQSLKLLESGKEIPAFRKMQSTKDKLYALLRRLNEKDTDQ